MNASVPASPGFAPHLWLVSFRRRIIVRGAFVLLIASTLALALALLTEEKARSYSTRQLGFEKTRAEILARLRHPAGQLALLNPGAGGRATPLRPLLLPYSAIDFDDRGKAHRAVELANCLIRYRDGGTICVAIGTNPYAGGFIYLVGSFVAGDLVPRSRGQLRLAGVHRARVELSMRGTTTRWVAPFESNPNAPRDRTHGRLTGFVDTGGDLPIKARPDRDFRGWLWQEPVCVEDTDDCRRRTFFSIRLPVDAFRDALFSRAGPRWPPEDLDRIRVHMTILAPGGAVPFDSNRPDATPPPTLDDVAVLLQPGETLRIRRPDGNRDLAIRTSAIREPEAISGWAARLIRALPAPGAASRIEVRDLVATPLGSYEVRLAGDLRGVERHLGEVVARLRLFVVAVLAAIGFAWLVVEIGFIRPIVILTRRAAAVSSDVQSARIGELDVSDLRGRDEVGILAGSLADLLRRVKSDLERERIRTAQEHDMWQAVGHEIMSPLQSLMVIHAHSDDPGHRYVQRMQQAVRVFYGSASPSEALAAATPHAGTLDLDAFLRNVAANAGFAGIADVRYEPLAEAVQVRADEYFLEDVVTHVLGNADRYRTPGTPITLALSAGEATAAVSIRNIGPGIDPGLLTRIFEYGVSDRQAEAQSEHRGQGLFVAKTYMAKMGGTVSAGNTGDGVLFTLGLQRQAG
ncbi:MAG: sensor histidine kinase [Gammaproteobacteria bacterium]